MKLFVCVKQVPDTDTRIKLLGDASSIDPAGVKWIANPYDLYAIEEAIKIREANPGTVVCVLTLGPKPRANEVLVTALAMGADDAILINSSQILDANQTAKALAEAIKSEGGGQLILMGKSSSDLNQSSVPQMLAHYLGMPHTTVVSRLQFSPESIVVDRDSDGGAKEIVQLRLPAVIAASKGLNTPRYTSLPGIMKAKKKVIKEIDILTLGISAAELKVKYSSLTLPPEKPAAKILAGDPAAQIQQLVKLLRDEAKVL